MKRKSIWLVLSLIVLLVVSGCGNKSTPTSSDPGASGDVKTVNIGYTGPLSGGGALFGKDVTEGLDLAVDEINAKGLLVNGEKYKINLIKLDDQYMPDKAATNARRLRTEFETPVIFVPHSGGAFALQQFNETDEFLIMAYTSEGKVAKTGNKLTVQMTTPYSLYPEVYSKKVMDKFGKKLALIPTSSQYGKDWSEAVIPAWEKLGGTIVANNPVDYNKEVDFNTYVSKALAANPDVLFVGGPSQPTAMVIKQARQLGFKGGFILMDQAKVEQMEGVIPLTDLEGAVCLTPVYLYDSPGAKPFVERFKAKYNGKVPAWESSKNYDNMMLLAKGIEKAGNVTDAAKILEGMRAVTPFNDPTITAHIPGIAEGGGSMTPGTGIMIENGQYGKQFSIPNPADTTKK
ncbi:ABC transporter substrate-binding protein [Desulfosporosinus sp.]|uniref:ABC transporter substrate-binding protein n=1 Tax=Desulfosporosinus sp. TaxID=157907 RepID=UPI0025C39443|nr:ABC transporter substrate-binding protein [Desulfosporosinus sp.]MBC2721544.1 ABC transporter substrate-binding protein [Desulfosporosinus sp.]MBC2726668.1 ABC transporter substrate-binding protein [Desulfosporosinus sp.]